jgi:Protein of unknown function (DUF2380)
MRTAALLALALALTAAAPAPSPAADQVALLPFELVNSSLEPTRPDETARMAMLDGAVAERMAAAGLEVVDPAPVAGEIAGLSSLRGCNGCEVGLGRKLGADFVAVGWVQKVSNLILNINLQVRDVRSGRLVAAGSTDIRGNTDESWRRGALYLLEHRILPPA